MKNRYPLDSTIIKVLAKKAAVPNKPFNDNDLDESQRGKLIENNFQELFDGLKATHRALKKNQIETEFVRAKTQSFLDKEKALNRNAANGIQPDNLQKLECEREKLQTILHNMHMDGGEPSPSSSGKIPLSEVPKKKIDKNLNSISVVILVDLLLLGFLYKQYHLTLSAFDIIYRSGMVLFISGFTLYFENKYTQTVHHWKRTVVCFCFVLSSLMLFSGVVTLLVIDAVYPSQTELTVQKDNSVSFLDDNSPVSQNPTIQDPKFIVFYKKNPVLPEVIIVFFLWCVVRVILLAKDKRDEFEVKCASDSVCQQILLSPEEEIEDQIRILDAEILKRHMQDDLSKKEREEEFLRRGDRLKTLYEEKISITNEVRSKLTDLRNEIDLIHAWMREYVDRIKHYNQEANVFNVSKEYIYNYYQIPFELETCDDIQKLTEILLEPKQNN